MKTRKLNNLMVLLFTTFSLHGALAQINVQNPSNDFWNNVRFGGSLGLGFGDGFFSGTLAPSGIYDVNDKFATGIGLNATYSTQKDFYKATIFGGSILGLYNIIPELQFSTEFEELHVSRKWDYRINLTDDNYWVPALFLGLGYRTQHVTFGIRYDILYNDHKSIYANPWTPFIRAYF